MYVFGRYDFGNAYVAGCRKHKQHLEINCRFKMGMPVGIRDTIAVSWPTACSMISPGQHLVYLGSIPSEDI